MSPVAVARDSADSAPAAGVEAPAGAEPVEAVELVEADGDPAVAEEVGELLEEPQPAAASAASRLAQASAF